MKWTLRILNFLKLRKYHIVDETSLGIPLGKDFRFVTSTTCYCNKTFKYHLYVQVRNLPLKDERMIYLSGLNDEQILKRENEQKQRNEDYQKMIRENMDRYLENFRNGTGEWKGLVERNH